MAKRAKSAVAYGPGHPAGDHCGICRHFRPPQACAVVAGEIRASMWCKRFEVNMADKPKRKHSFIKKATANAHGQLRRKAEAAGESTREFANRHEHDAGRTGKQARLADTLMNLRGSRKRYAPKSVRKG